MGRGCGKKRYGRDIEFDAREKWGGETKLTNGDVWFITPMVKKMPCEVEAKRLSQGE